MGEKNAKKHVDNYLLLFFPTFSLSVIRSALWRLGKGASALCKCMRLCVRYIFFSECVLVFGKLFYPIFMNFLQLRENRRLVNVAFEPKKTIEKFSFFLKSTQEFTKYSKETIRFNSNRLELKISTQTKKTLVEKIIYMYFFKFLIFLQ